MTNENSSALFFKSCNKSLIILKEEFTCITPSDIQVSHFIEGNEVRLLWHLSLQCICGSCIIAIGFLDDETFDLYYTFIKERKLACFFFYKKLKKCITCNEFDSFK